MAAHTAESDDVYVPHDMRAQVIAPDVVMVTNVLAVGDSRSNRTSLWRLTPGGQWQMFHHQGTRVPAPPRAFGGGVAAPDDFDAPLPDDERAVWE